ncbi:eCIS core domain-containing protein [Methanosarcina sp. T3]|uniref:eCIS core domain-containing protein n=1 Tax=Methanosarcina sp. T3 TaxID=3439062 RepID=UPI003F84A374
MEPINKAKKEQEIGGFVFPDLERQTTSLIVPGIRIIPKYIQFSEKLLGKYAYLNKIFRMSLSPLSGKQLTGKSTEKRFNQDLFKSGLWEPVTDSHKKKGNSQIRANEVNIKTFSGMINNLKARSEFDLIKNRIQAQKLKKSCLTESKVIHHSKSDSEISRKKDSFENFEKKAEKSSYFYLDSSLKDFLAGILNIQIPAVKIYANRLSDGLTKQFNADALTFKNRVFFKTGKYNSRDRKGIALLGHELTHVAQIEIEDHNFPGPGPIGYGYEEQEAIDNEKKVLRYLPSAEPYSMNKIVPGQGFFGNSFNGYRFGSETYGSHENSISPDPFSASSPSSDKYHTQVRTPRTALASRDLNLPSEPDADLNLAFQFSDQQFKLIKEDVYRDIMNRIRIEFERGG